MSHSLKAKLSGLKHKQLITDKEYQRLKDGLDLLNKKGRWIKVIDSETVTTRMHHYACSNCGGRPLKDKELHDVFSAWCPHCGCAMEDKE